MLSPTLAQHCPSIGRALRLPGMPWELLYYSGNGTTWYNMALGFVRGGISRIPMLPGFARGLYLRIDLFYTPITPKKQVIQSEFFSGWHKVKQIKVPHGGPHVYLQHAARLRLRQESIRLYLIPVWAATGILRTYYPHAMKGIRSHVPEISATIHFAQQSEQAASLLSSLTSRFILYSKGGGPRVVVSTAAFHARVRGSVPGLGGLKETKLFLPHPRVKVSIVGSLRDREVACSASDRQGPNFESCVWRTVSSQSSHHPQEVLLAQFSLYVHKGGLKPDSFHFIFTL